MTNCTLSYFAIADLAEPIRYVLNYGGMDFEDNRINQEAWPALKPHPYLINRGTQYARKELMSAQSSRRKYLIPDTGFIFTAKGKQRVNKALKPAD